MFAFVLRGHSISASHSISKQNDRGSEYFKIERPGGQKLGGHLISQHWRGFRWSFAATC